MLIFYVRHHRIALLQTYRVSQFPPPQKKGLKQWNNWDILYFSWFLRSEICITVPCMTLSIQKSKEFVHSKQQLIQLVDYHYKIELMWINLSAEANKLFAFWICMQYFWMGKNCYPVTRSSCSTGGEGGRLGSRWRLKWKRSNWIIFISSWSISAKVQYK